MLLGKVTRNHQITLPKDVREPLGIEVGDHVEVRMEGDRIVIAPVRLAAGRTEALSGRSVAELRRAMAPVLRRYGIEAAWLFGAAARGEAGPGSDVDLLVELPDDFGPDDMDDLAEDLEQAVGARLVILETGNLKPRVRDQVGKDKAAIL